MRDRGYPNARLDVFAELDGLTYGWTEDLDRVLMADFGSQTRDAFDAAHEVFVEVDHLRPEEVAPSWALLERLGRRGRS